MYFSVLVLCPRSDLNSSILKYQGSAYQHISEHETGHSCKETSFEGNPIPRSPLKSGTNHMVNINKWNVSLNHRGAPNSYELCSLAPNELWRWEGAVRKTPQMYTGCDLCVTVLQPWLSRNWIIVFLIIDVVKPQLRPQSVRRSLEKME